MRFRSLPEEVGGVYIIEKVVAGEWPNSKRINPISGMLNKLSNKYHSNDTKLKEKAISAFKKLVSGVNELSRWVSADQHEEIDVQAAMQLLPGANKSKERYVIAYSPPHIGRIFVHLARTAGLLEPIRADWLESQVADHFMDKHQPLRMVFEGQGLPPGTAVVAACQCSDWDTWDPDQWS